MIDDDDDLVELLNWLELVGWAAFESWKEVSDECECEAKE